MANKVSFFRTTAEKYAALNRDYKAGAVYFVSDGTSGKIYLEGKCYGEMNAEITAVKAVSFDEAQNSLKIEYTVGEPTYVALPEGAIYTAGDGIKIENKVISALDETLNEDLTVMGVSVGNLTDGSKIDAGTSLQDLLKKMLTKELDYSKDSGPSVVLKGVTGGIMLAGTEISGPLTHTFTDGKFTSSFNGAVNAGCVAGTPTYTPQLPIKLNLGEHTFEVSLPYEASTAQATLKTNTGNPSKVEAFPAGTATNSIKINGTLPVYATTVSADTMTQQKLVAWTTPAGSMESPEMTMVASTPDAPIKFSTPREAKSLMQYNTVAKQYESVALSAYTKTTETREFGNISNVYYVYTFAGSAQGSVKLKVKF